MFFPVEGKDATQNCEERRGVWAEEVDQNDERVGEATAGNCGRDGERGVDQGRGKAGH